jgi:RNase P protein component
LLPAPPVLSSFSDHFRLGNQMRAIAKVRLAVCRSRYRRLIKLA